MNIRLGIVIAAPVLLASCHEVSTTGHSSFRFVDEVGAPPSAPVDASKLRVVESMNVVIPPKPIGPLSLPKYPPEALKAHLHDIHLAVAITIDESGKVVDVERSIARLPYTIAFQDEFFTEASRAVYQWRFEPGQLAHIVPQSDGRPLVTGTENTPSKLTVAFTFSASGKVVPE